MKESASSTPRVPTIQDAIGELRAAGEYYTACREPLSVSDPQVWWLLTAGDIFTEAADRLQKGLRRAERVYGTDVIQRANAVLAQARTANAGATKAEGSQGESAQNSSSSSSGSGEGVAAPHQTEEDLTRMDTTGVPADSRTAPTDDPATTELLEALDELYPLPDDAQRAERAGRTAFVLKRWMARAHAGMETTVLKVLDRVRTEASARMKR